MGPSGFTVGEFQHSSGIRQQVSQVFDANGFIALGLRHDEIGRYGRGNPRRYRPCRLAPPRRSGRFPPEPYPPWRCNDRTPIAGGHKALNPNRLVTYCRSNRLFRRYLTLTWGDDAHCKPRRTQLIGNRPNRVEPRAVKRRPKPHKLLTKPRAEARAELMAGAVK